MNFSDTFAAIWANKFTFLVSFFIIFTIIYGVLYVVDFLPEPPTEEALEAAPVTDTAPAVITEEVTVFEEAAVVDTEISAPADDSGDMPVSIYIERLDKTVTVLNPASRSISDLDHALLSGVVRHPDSAMPNVNGNVFILGHSSYLPTVLNKNFQAFNGIQKLEWGDTITLSSEDVVYTYRVEKVYKAKASDVTVPVEGDDKRLTIATCNSFGSTDDRYIVEAKQIGVANIS